MGRVAALLILASQIVLLWVVFDPTGLPSIWFSFAGHPLVAVVSRSDSGCSRVD
jgi:hypothetical protein